MKISDTPYVSHEPEEYAFRDLNGYHGKLFTVPTKHLAPLIVECDDRMMVSLQQNEVERLYYILEGEGYFEIDGVREPVKRSDLVTLPVGTVFTFGGKLKMLLVDSPRWSLEQEEII